MKKLSLFILSITLIISSLSVYAYNPSLTDEQKLDLYNLSIMVGDQNGDLHLKDNISRAEAAKMICVASGYETAEADEAFPDVSAEHWAYKYIAAAKKEGIVCGDENGNFNPESDITNEEIIKMLVCIIGFEPMADQKGGYPAGYRTVASTYGITEGMSFDIDVPAIREDVGLMILRAIDTPMLVKNKLNDDNTEYSIADGKNGRVLITLRSGVTGFDTSNENVVRFTNNFASRYEYKEGDIEKSEALYPDRIRMTGTEKDRWGKEYELPALYLDTMVGDLIAGIVKGNANVKYGDIEYSTDYIIYNKKMLMPYYALSKLGYDTEIYPTQYMAYISDGTTTLELLPNLTGMRKNEAEGYWVPLETSARIYDNTIYVPVDEVLYEYGLKAELDEANKVINVSEK